MQKYTLHPTGARPIQFTGEKTFSRSGAGLDPTSETRWHEIALYETTADNTVLAVQYNTTWGRGNEHNRMDVFVCETRADAAYEIEHYDPTWYVAGFPPLERYRDRQANLLKQVISNFEDLASAALDCLGVAFQA
jgi:hypothetical protein